MPQLTYLGVPYSKLTNLDISKLTKLKSLECRNNKLTHIDLSQQPDLELIDVIANNLKELDISGKKNLYYVSIAHNEIKGEKMEQLVNTLPLRGEGYLELGHLFVFTLDTPSEGNVNTNDLNGDKKYFVGIPYEGSPTALEHLVQETPTAYYNASSQEVVLLSPKMCNWRLLAPSGEEIKRGAINTQERTTIDASQLPSGVYFIVLDSEVIKLLIA